MSVTTDAIAAAVNLIVLGAQWVAISRRSLSEFGRPGLSALGLICAWSLALILEALRAPPMVLVASGAVTLVSLGVLTGTVYRATRDVGPAASGEDDGATGAEPPRPDRGGGGDPDWWPEFELQLADYVRQRQRGEDSRSPVPPVPAGSLTPAGLDHA